MCHFHFTSRQRKRWNLFVCKSCKIETKYICLICKEPVCNRAECAFFLPDETPNWISGTSVSACLPCHSSSGTRNEEEWVERPWFRLRYFCSASHIKSSMWIKSTRETTKAYQGDCYEKKKVFKFTRELTWLNTRRITQTQATAKPPNTLVLGEHKHKKS